MKCCAAASRIYGVWFDYLVTVGVGLLLVCIASVVFLYFLSNRYVGDKQLNRNIELVYFFIFFVFVFFIGFCYSGHLKVLKNDDPT